ncbi:MAG: (5-formylfuran-3-yl)methyl phosphate synthase [Gemmatimonadales bacterium]
MRLLASVRSVNEVEAAVSGGADIIDAKEPSSGSLGAVAPAIFARIQARVPVDLELSAALGDAASSLEVRNSIAGLRVVPRSAPVYLKLGFSGVRSPERLRALLEVACAAAAETGCPPPRIIAVAYADHENAGCADPGTVWDAAAAAGVAGILIDTWSKGSRHLFDWIEPERLRDLVDQARRAGLLTALAGGLGPEQLPGVSRVDPDIVGFRGALCPKGRQGKVSQLRVKQLKRLVVASGSIRRAELPSEAGPGRETPEAAANLCRASGANPLRIND